MEDPTETPVDKEAHEYWERRKIEGNRIAVASPIKKETILEEAARLVNGPRRQEYGHPKENFKDIASMWNIYLREKLPAMSITASDVTMMMTLLKVCRAKQGYKRDTAADLCGYGQCYGLVNDDD